MTIRFWQKGKVRCIRCGKYHAEDSTSGGICSICRSQLQDGIAFNVGAIAILTAMVKRAKAVDDFDTQAVEFHQNQARKALGLIASNIQFGIAAGIALRDALARFELFSRMIGKETLLVVAGNYEQFRYWARENRIPVDRHVRYVSSERQIAGQDPETVLVVYTGQPHLNPLYATSRLELLISLANPDHDAWYPDLSNWRKSV